METKERTESPDAENKPQTTVDVAVLGNRFHITCPAEKAESMKEAEKRLTKAAERYVQEQLERRFPALDYYKKVK